MTVNELMEVLKAEVEAGHGDWPVWKSDDEEGNGFEPVYQVEANDYETFDHEEYSWFDDWPESSLVVIW